MRELPVWRVRWQFVSSWKWLGLACVVFMSTLLVPGFALKCVVLGIAVLMVLVNFAAFVAVWMGEALRRGDGS